MVERLIQLTSKWVKDFHRSSVFIYSFVSRKLLQCVNNFHKTFGDKDINCRFILRFCILLSHGNRKLHFIIHLSFVIKTARLKYLFRCWLKFVLSHLSLCAYFLNYWNFEISLHIQIRISYILSRYFLSPPLNQFAYWWCYHCHIIRFVYVPLTHPCLEQYHLRPPLSTPQIMFNVSGDSTDFVEYYKSFAYHTRFRENEAGNDLL